MTAPNAAQARSRNLGYYRYLNQGETWLPKDKPSIPIADMDPAWRANAAAWLERRAETFALYYMLGEIELAATGQISEAAMECWAEALEERDRDLAAWMRSTPLYRALAAGLPYSMWTAGAQIEAVTA